MVEAVGGDVCLYYCTRNADTVVQHTAVGERYGGEN
jgi:hypothetical protein